MERKSGISGHRRYIASLSEKLGFLAGDLARKKHGLSMAGLSRALGLSRNWLIVASSSGRNTMSIDVNVERKLAQVCNFDVSWPEWTDGSLRQFMGKYLDSSVKYSENLLLEASDGLNYRSHSTGGAERPVKVKDAESDGGSASLIAALEDQDIGVRIESLKRLSRLQSNEVIESALRRALEDPDQAVRIAALNALHASGANDPATIRSLRNLYHNSDRRAQMAIISFLGKIANNNALAIPALIDVLSEPDAGLRFEAARVLGDIVSPNTELISILISLLRDAEPLVRMAVVGALGRIAHTDNSVIAPLIIALEDKDIGVRAAAIDALGEIDPPNAAALLAVVGSFFYDLDPGVRATAEAVLRDKLAK
jgi:transcriptional regulator with XRE-family HTH domain